MNDRGETEFLTSHVLEAEKLLMRSQGSRKKPFRQMKVSKFYLIAAAIRANNKQDNFLRINQKCKIC